MAVLAATLTTIPSKIGAFAQMSNYNFTSLSPSDFEILIRDLLYAKYGWRLEAFASGPDGGVDLRMENCSTKIIVQCKHYAGSKFSNLTHAAKRELPKIQSEDPKIYVFATTYNLTKLQKDTLRRILEPWIKSSDHMLSQKDINLLIEEYPEIERKHFKLWMTSTRILQRVTQSGLWARSEALMETIEDRARLYVPNRNYSEAAEKLDSLHSIVIGGPPGVGKTMLSEMLAITHWQDGWQVITINETIEEGWSSWNSEQHQIFLFDDFLGQTDIQEGRYRNEGNSVAKFMDRVTRSERKRFILTTRTHIIRQAQVRTESLTRAVNSINEHLMSIDTYSEIERARILYNHLYFSSHPRETVREFAASRVDYRAIVKHPNFNPRIIEQILRRPQPDGSMIARSILKTFDRPLDLWGPSFENSLSKIAQNILLLLICHPTGGISEKILRHALQDSTEPIRYKHALKSLEGSWVHIGTFAGQASIRIRFANPSCRDFILSFIDENPVYLQFYLTRASTLEEICTLLNYSVAKSESGQGWKYPNLNREIRETRKDVTTSTHANWIKQASNTALNQTIEKCICDLIELDEILELEIHDWLPSAVIAITPNSELSYTPHIESSRTVIRYLVKHLIDLTKGSAQLQAGRSALRVWVRELANCANNDEEWLTLGSELSPIDGCVIDSEGFDSIRNIIQKAATTHYQEEISELLHILDYDRSSIESRIEQILCVATSIGVADALQDSINEARASLPVATDYDPFESDTWSDSSETDIDDEPSNKLSIYSNKLTTRPAIEDEIDSLFSNLR
jgi:hypothetical protein